MSSVVRPALTSIGSPDGVLVRTHKWNPEARQLWADFADQSPAMSPLADPIWFDVIGHAWRPARHLHVASRDGHVIGVLPVYVVRGLRGERHAFSPKHALAVRDPAASTALVDTAAAHARAVGAHSATITSGYEELAAPCQHFTKTSLELLLPADPAMLWRGFRDKVRNTIRKAERSDVHIVQDPKWLDTFWRIQAESMAARGLPVKPRRLFRAIAELFGERMTLLMALRDGRALGGVIILRGRGVAAYAYGAFGDEGRQTGVSSLLLWQAAQGLISSGIHSLDLGESMPNGGTYRFKARLGGQARAINYYLPLKPRSAAGQTGISEPSSDLPRARSRSQRLVTALPGSLRLAMLTWLGARGRLL